MGSVAITPRESVPTNPKRVRTSREAGPNSYAKLCANLCGQEYEPVRSRAAWRNCSRALRARFGFFRALRAPLARWGFCVIGGYSCGLILSWPAVQCGRR